jgi:hypothetical protein
VERKHYGHKKIQNQHTVKMAFLEEIVPDNHLLRKICLPVSDERSVMLSIEKYKEEHHKSVIE